MDSAERVLIIPANQVTQVAAVLSSELRKNIVTLLYGRKLNINEIAQELRIPQSTCATNVQMLERAGLIQTVQMPAGRGAQKVCTSTCQEVVLSLMPEDHQDEDNLVHTNMPVGLYTDCQITTPCGLLSNTGVIGYFDNPESFLDPHRATAQLIWFSSGYVEYRFPRNLPAGRKIKSVWVTAEVCSEFPGCNTNWPSDITMWINDVEVGTWTSPGDMGDKRGMLTPDWWRVGDTQYGFLKTWKVTDECSFIDGVRCSEISTRELQVNELSHVTVRIGVKSDAENCGGVNIFGNHFGNYEKDIELRLELEK